MNMREEIINTLIKELNEIKETINEALEDLNQERGLSDIYKLTNILEAYFGDDYSDVLEDYNESTGDN